MGGLTCGCSGRRLAFREKCKCPGNITAKRRQQTKRIVGRYAERPRDGSPLPLLGEQSPKNSLAYRAAERLRLLRQGVREWSCHPIRQPIGSIGTMPRAAAIEGAFAGHALLRPHDRPI